VLSLQVSAIALLLIAAILFRPVDSDLSYQDSSAQPARVGGATSIDIAADLAFDKAPDVVDDLDREPSEDASSEWFWLSMVFVMFAFGGWNDIAFVACEARDPKKNLFRALLLGTAGVVAIYVLVNLALLYGLGFDRLKTLASSDTSNGSLVLARESFGEIGTIILGVSVCLSCLGAISAMIFTSPRIYWATADDDPRIAQAIGGRKRAWLAVVIQAVVTLAMMSAFSQTTKGFDAIVTACAPYFWSFLSLTVSTVFVNRFRYRGQFSGFRIPLYPVPPSLFIAACWFMTARSIQYMLFQKLHWQAVAIGIWVILGLLIGVYLVASKSKDPVKIG
jgi:amino acid transporter